MRVLQPVPSVGIGCWTPPIYLPVTRQQEYISSRRIPVIWMKLKLRELKWIEIDSRTEMKTTSVHLVLAASARYFRLAPSPWNLWNSGGWDAEGNIFQRSHREFLLNHFRFRLFPLPIFRFSDFPIFRAFEIFCRQLQLTKLERAEWMQPAVSHFRFNTPRIMSQPFRELH